VSLDDYDYVKGLSDDIRYYLASDVLYIAVIKSSCKIYVWHVYFLLLACKIYVWHVYFLLLGDNKLCIPRDLFTKVLTVLTDPSDTKNKVSLSTIKFIPYSDPE
jgi:hypothetical protein